jgi:SAM-dependent methyltransferase
VVLGLLLSISGCVHNGAIESHALALPGDAHYTSAQAASFAAMAEGPLAVIYPLLAAQIVAEFDLAERPAIGVDLGGGPGTLIVELCRQTKSTYWTNADINPHNFPHFYRALDEAELGHRAGAILADAHALPFCDGYADIVVSRGTYQFWGDQHRAFSEIMRILKPGGVAFIGRGLPDALPPELARSVREKHGSGPSYDVTESGQELEGLMRDLGVRDFRVHTFVHPDAPDVSYGLWLVFRK